jgi:hypothetical protein
VIEVFTWAHLSRWLSTRVQSAIPGRLLAWLWPRKRLLDGVQVFHFNSAPHFYVRADRDTHTMEFAGFNIFNLTPFNLTILGADVSVTIDGKELFRLNERFAAEIPMTEYARSGFHIRRELTEGQTQRLRSYPQEWALVRLVGNVVIRTPYGEQRKELQADVVGVIDQ